MFSAMWLKLKFEVKNMHQSARSLLLYALLLIDSNVALGQTEGASQIAGRSTSEEFAKIIVPALVGCLFGIVSAFFTTLFTMRSKIKEAEMNFEYKVREAETNFGYKTKEIQEQFRTEIEKERSKWLRAREDAIAQELRLAVLQLSIKMATALHSMCWLTWVAEDHSDHISSDRFKSYDDELHKLLPEIAGSLAAVAALDKDTYKQLAPITEQIYGIDFDIGEAGLLWEETPVEGCKALVKCYEKATALEKGLPKMIANIVSKRMEQRASQVSSQA